MHLLENFHCVGVSAFVSALGLLGVLAIGVLADYVRGHQQRRRLDEPFRLPIDVWNVPRLPKC